MKNILPFLVSAVRKNGITQWVRVKSLAGERCRIRPGLEGEANATVPLKVLGDGVYELPLAKGGEAILFVGGKVPNCEVAPVAADPGKCNYYGLPSAD
jgi:alpha-L-fucosidase 2